MNKAYLLTGGNVGDRQKNLDRAKSLIGKRAGRIIKSSAMYETAAWGKTDQHAFLNQALEVETSHSPLELIEVLLGIEKEIGRVRSEKYGPRIIDIDILLIDNLVVKENSLKVPHPELQNRRFALTPLAEIAPQLKHPVTHKTIIKLLDECPDKLEVVKFS